MKFETVRRAALVLPETTEEPHHHFGSFRVRGKIFITVPPDNTHIHVFLSEQDREQALAAYPDFTEKLLWGGKVVGLRVTLATAPEPLDPRVRLREEPAVQRLVIRYSGMWSQANYDEHLAKLKAAAAGAGIATEGEPVLARYNGPMTPWFLRRNEVWRVLTAR